MLLKLLLMLPTTVLLIFTLEIVDNTLAIVFANVLLMLVSETLLVLLLILLTIVLAILLVVKLLLILVMLLVVALPTLRLLVVVSMFATLPIVLSVIVMLPVPGITGPLTPVTLPPVTLSIVMLALLPPVTLATFASPNITLLYVMLPPAELPLKLAVLPLKSWSCIITLPTPTCPLYVIVGPNV